uniref:Uncharacterized protein n=1 Tax=Tanacetum cinerariifolium TaxID=118510 RepID=A0A699I2S0_TANCI|nr:hypothetical protein [Tanacetum cinerariifolium]
MKEREVKAKKDIEQWLKESEMRPQESLVTESTTLEASLVTEGATLEASLVTDGAALEASLITKGIAMDDNLVAKQSTYDFVTSSKLLDECNNSIEKKDKMKEREVKAKRDIKQWLKESEMQPQESLVTESTTLKASLVTEGATLEASLVTEGAALEASVVTKGIAMDDNFIVKERTNDFVTSLELQDECNNSMEKKDTITLCSYSGEQRMQQLQMEAIIQK